MKPVTKKIILSTIFILILIVDIYLYIANPLNKSTLDVSSESYSPLPFGLINGLLILIGVIVIRKRVDAEKRHIAMAYFLIALYVVIGLLYFIVK